MKSTTRRNRKTSTRSAASKAGQARWLPSDNTRPVVFADRPGARIQASLPRAGARLI